MDNDPKIPGPVQDFTSPQLVLILGGARSGKSTFAEQLARQSDHLVAFIATATAGDSDMQDRIARHQAARPVNWQTIEEPLNIAQAVQRAARESDVLLLDCLTLWLSNWLTSQGDPHLIEVAAISSHYVDGALAEIDALLSVFAGLPSSKTLIVISNEVGMGIVPAFVLGRIYRDLLGRVNQHLAARAGRVYLMVAGLGVDIKRLHETARL